MHRRRHTHTHTENLYAHTLHSMTTNQLPWPKQKMHTHRLSARPIY